MVGCSFAVRCRVAFACLVGVQGVVRAVKTYRQIQRQAAAILNVRPSTVRRCWIAEVKRALGLTRGPAPNTGQGRGAPPCPKKYKVGIRRVLEREGR